MADTDWNAFPDRATLYNDDTLLVAAFNGAGTNVPGAAVAKQTEYCLDGSLGAITVEGSTDWNDLRSCRSGSAPTLLLGNAAHGPGGTDYYHPLNFEYAARGGFGQITQVAIPYASSNFQQWVRGRFGGTWSPWRQYLIEGGSSDFSAATDNTKSLGLGIRRFTAVFVTSGTISTSDEREKVWRGGLSAAHLRAARRIITEVGLYQWNDAIAEKGADGARLHIGPRAQAVARIMVEEGLEAPFEDGGVPHFRHAFLCYDRWDEAPARPAVAEVRDDAGEIVTPAQPAGPAIPAGDRFGLRVDQLTLFLMAALLGGNTAD